MTTQVPLGVVALPFVGTGIEADPIGVKAVSASPAGAVIQPGETTDAQGMTNQRGAKKESVPWSRRYAARLAVTDVLAIVWAAVGVHVVGLGSFTSRVSRDPGSLTFLATTVFLAAAWVVALHWGGTREASVVGHGADEYKRIIQSSFALFGAVSICSFIFDLDLPRAYVLVMLPAGLSAILVSRFAWRRWLHVRRNRGDYVSRVLVVGSLRTVQDLVSELSRAPLHGYRVIGACLRSEVALDLRAQKAMPVGVPILGGLDDVARLAREFGADTVAVTSTAAFGSARVRRLGWELEDTSIDLVLAPALTNIAGPRVHTTPVAGLPLIHVGRPTYRGANRVLKRSFDLFCGFWATLLLIPLLAVLAIMIKVADGGPVFFRQPRVGLNGRSFRMIKFRSMVTNAEELLGDLRKSERDVGNDVLFKLRSDPRVTGIGKFLRRFSLDELPQLFNVLLGDMSLVGPRPPLRIEVDAYGDEAMIRLLVKPGMTGLWQVSGRSDLTWEDSIRLDTYYVENWSITGDLVILWKTAKAVTASSGAY